MFVSVQKPASTKGFLYYSVFNLHDSCPKAVSKVTNQFENFMQLGRARLRTRTASAAKLQGPYLSTKEINRFYTFILFQRRQNSEKQKVFEEELKIVQYLIERLHRLMHLWNASEPCYRLVRVVDRSAKPHLVKGLVFKDCFNKEEEIVKKSFRGSDTVKRPCDANRATYTRRDVVRRCWPYTTSRWDLGFIRLNPVLVCFRLEQNFGIPVRIRRKTIVLKKSRIDHDLRCVPSAAEILCRSWYMVASVLKLCITRFGLVYDSGNRKQTRDGFISKSWHQFNDNHWKMKVKFLYFSNRLKLDMLEYISYLKSVRRIHLQDI